MSLTKNYKIKMSNKLCDIKVLLILTKKVENCEEIESEVVNNQEQKLENRFKGEIIP